jgi:pimeloyl-ACP methyl ester carboxylesterase
MTKAQVDEEEASLLFASSLPGLLVDSGLPTYVRDGSFGRSPAYSPPILVLQGSLDLKTPIEGALARIAELPKTGQVELVRVEASPHFVLLNAPDCFEEAVRQFVTRRKFAAPACQTPSAHSALR